MSTPKNNLFRSTIISLGAIGAGSLLLINLTGADNETNSMPTQNAVYNIENCDDLQKIANGADWGTYNLTKDIDCKNVTFRPIEFHGYQGPFKGVLNGNNFKISNLTIKNEQGSKDLSSGIFRELSSATIKNITFEKSTVLTKDEADRGLIAGKATGTTQDPTIIKNITILGLEIKNDEGGKQKGASGGLIGTADHTEILNVHIRRTDVQQYRVRKNRHAGGLVGIANANVTIKQSSVNSLLIDNFECLNEFGQICGVGGLIGLVNGDGINITQSSATGTINGILSAMGGLIGMLNPQNHVHIQDSFASVGMYTNGSVVVSPGGLIGTIYHPVGSEPAYVTLQNVYSAAKIEPYNYAFVWSRGIVGEPISEIPDPNDPEIPEPVLLPEGTIAGAQSYFDKSLLAGEFPNSGEVSGDSFSIGLTTSEMKDPVNFPETIATPHNIYDTPWDRNIWTFTPGAYPALKSCKDTPMGCPEQ